MQSPPKGNKPAYVRVYDTLYGLLTDETFRAGEALPSEPKLAAMLGVSRMTLRQALELLHDDGLVEKIRGKGNFVTNQNRPATTSLEKLGNPVHNCIQLPIDPEVELDMRLELPSEYERNLFKRPTAVAVAADRWYRSNGTLIAYTLSLCPIETISKLEVDLNDQAALLDVLERKIYSVATRARIKVQTTWAGSFISDKYVLAEKGELWLLHEALYTNDNLAPLLYNKHYMLPKSCSIEINAVQGKAPYAKPG